MDKLSVLAIVASRLSFLVVHYAIEVLADQPLRGRAHLGGNNGQRRNRGDVRRYGFAKLVRTHRVSSLCCLVYQKNRAVQGSELRPLASPAPWFAVAGVYASLSPASWPRRGT